MGTFIVTVSATSHATPNTEEMLMELRSAASTTVFIKRITVSCGDTTPADKLIEVKLTRNSTAGTFTSGTNFIPVSTRINNPSSLAVAGLATCIIKNGTNNSNTLGTVTDTPKRGSTNTRNFYEWIARDEYSKIECGVNAWFELTMKVSKTLMVVIAEIEFEV